MSDRELWKMPDNVKAKLMESLSEDAQAIVRAAAEIGRAME